MGMPARIVAPAGIAFESVETLYGVVATLFRHHNEMGVLASIELRSVPVIDQNGGPSGAVIGIDVHVERDAAERFEPSRLSLCADPTFTKTAPELSTAATASVPKDRVCCFQNLD